MKDQIIELLKSTKREGIEKMIEYIDSNGFFESPASTRFHGCYEGGLAKHSYNVYRMLIGYDMTYKLNSSIDSMIIAALLHDVCKIGAYLGDSMPYKWNRQQPKGHAELSLHRINAYIQLTELEEKMIRYHMGVYGLKEFDEKKGEYTLRNKSMANAWYHHPIVKVMYFCDELATLQEKCEEKI